MGEAAHTGRDSCAHVSADADGFGVRDVDGEEKWKVRMIRDHEETVVGSRSRLPVNIRSRIIALHRVLVSKVVIVYVQMYMFQRTTRLSRREAIF